MNAPVGDEMLPSPFHFLRHGESENNALDLVNGQTDSRLTERGREQARQAAVALASCGVQAVLTSPLSRARETAVIVACLLDVAVAVVDDLSERHWGVLENRPRSLLTDYFMVPEGGESWDAYRARVWAALAGGTMPAHALVVGHAGTMRVLRDGLRIGDEPARLPNGMAVCFTRAAHGWQVSPVADMRRGVVDGC